MDNNYRFWERNARFYTYLQEKQNANYYAEILALMEEYIQDKDVLELACGTGQFSFGINRKVRSLVASDYSKQMIIEAEKRNQAGIVFEIADATKLKYDKEQFDVVVMANALHIMPESEKVIQEIHRVLKKDGLLILPNFVYDGKYNHRRMWILKCAGFKTYHKWHSDELIEYVNTKDFELLRAKIIEARPLNELFAVFKKK